ncbi:MAG: hypothetical protein CL943_02760 [Candidatus Diapherotrites archaeon]|uniref:Uncharacterized protein n=1 Tax=Candidatus Iainarchaeum sp. TaxID=3101447 RepID=A0A2D6M194_9ARCH|nr:hypothetical protein [Candidatus Diapherotrites archaeon]|tara:strand:- start:5226 stop:6302 length:1077 start_codon:yes stop_codon:yes gene_type:complete
MHFYESSIITTKDGLHCQVYGNEHPDKGILIKPKYIPTNKIECEALQCRFLSGKKMNRLNLWAEKNGLANYLEKFKKAYPQYIYQSEVHDKDRLFFWAPKEHIERVYFPREGLAELMSMPEDALDEHLAVVYKFVNFLLESGLRLKDFGITYSTLMGHYIYNMSDINLVVYGKENFWKLMEYMERAEHPSLRWKDEKEWLEFYKKRNRYNIFEKNTFLNHMISRKKSEGYFDNLLFVIFAAEKEEEVWFKWGQEKYSSIGMATVEGTVTDHHSSVVRPGCYTIGESKLIDSDQDIDVEKVVFYSRDYTLLAYTDEKIQARGILEKVEPKDGKPYHRIVTGYFDSYITDRREEEFIKVI